MCVADWPSPLLIRTMCWVRVGGKPVSDVSYSVGPTLALDETRSRLHFVLNYAPGFTFYQRTSSRNEQDQNVSFNLHYRLSPHVTFLRKTDF